MWAREARAGRAEVEDVVRRCGRGIDGGDCNLVRSWCHTDATDGRRIFSGPVDDDLDPIHNRLGGPSVAP